MQIHTTPIHRNVALDVMRGWIDAELALTYFNYDDHPKAELVAEVYSVVLEADYIVQAHGRQWIVIRKDKDSHNDIRH